MAETTEAKIRHLLSKSMAARLKTLKIRAYDFRRPDRFSRQQIEALGILHETFARLCCLNFSGQLRLDCNVHVESVDQFLFSEIMGSLTEPATMGILRMPPPCMGMLFFRLITVWCLISSTGCWPGRDRGWHYSGISRISNAG